MARQERGGWAGQRGSGGAMLGVGAGGKGVDGWARAGRRGPGLGGAVGGLQIANFLWLDALPNTSPPPLPELGPDNTQALAGLFNLVRFFYLI